MKHWWCMECQAKVGLGKHGRCGVCDSEAVHLLSPDGDLNRSVSAAPVDSDAALAKA
jgi:hypothetical protein